MTMRRMNTSELSEASKLESPNSTTGVKPDLANKGPTAIGRTENPNESEDTVTAADDALTAAPTGTEPDEGSLNRWYKESTAVL